MRIAKLRLKHLRCFDEIELITGSRHNWLVGPNGAGKSTLLEAIYVLSHGHSFRRVGWEPLVQRGQEGFSLYAEVLTEAGALHTLGMQRNAEGWRLRLDGADQTTMAPLFERCAATCFEPDSHQLITGAAEGRRRFVDWGVFHVEHGFLTCWRQYRRALQQRNVLLRSMSGQDQLDAWESELERWAWRIESVRRAYLERLQPHLNRVFAELLPELGQASLHYQPGWNVGRTLSELLIEHREMDRRRGQTRLGPHRADWRIEFENAPNRAYLSRGELKLTALCCVLAQAALFTDSTGEWPILCLDDLSSELDANHLESVLEHLHSYPMQVWITSTQPSIPAQMRKSSALFHVEQSGVRPA